MQAEIEAYQQARLIFAKAAFEKEDWREEFKHLRGTLQVLLRQLPLPKAVYYYYSLIELLGNMVPMLDKTKQHKKADAQLRYKAILLQDCLFDVQVESGWVLFEKSTEHNNAELLQRIFKHIVSAVICYIEVNFLYIEALDERKEVEDILFFCQQNIRFYFHFIKQAERFSLTCPPGLQRMKMILLQCGKICVNEYFTQGDYEQAKEAVAHYGQLLTLFDDGELTKDLASKAFKEYRALKELLDQHGSDAQEEKAAKKRRANRLKKQRQKIKAQLKKQAPAALESTDGEPDLAWVNIAPLSPGSQHFVAVQIEVKANPPNDGLSQAITTLEALVGCEATVPLSIAHEAEVSESSKVVAVQDSEAYQQDIVSGKPNWLFRNDDFHEVVHRLEHILPFFAECHAYLYGSIHYKKYPHDMDILLVVNQEGAEKDFFRALERQGAQKSADYGKSGVFYRHVVKYLWHNVAIDFIVTRLTLQQHSAYLDFTIGAVYYDVGAQQTLYLQTTAKQDIAQKQLRLIGDPLRILSRDPSIVLRAVRLIATEGFQLESHSYQALQQLMEATALFERMNPDKLYHELVLCFFSGQAQDNLRVINELGLFSHLFASVNGLNDFFKAFSFYLVQQVSVCSDQHYAEKRSLPPSLLLYAANWFVFIRDSVPALAMQPKVNLKQGAFPYWNSHVDYLNRCYLSQLEQNYYLTPTVSFWNSRQTNQANDVNDPALLMPHEPSSSQYEAVVGKRG